MDFEDYDPKVKAKDPRRTRRARQRLAAALGVVALLGVLAYSRTQGQKAPPTSPAPTGRAAKQQAVEARPPPAPKRVARLSVAERMAALSPIFRGPGKVEMLPAFANANRVLLATHNRLMWYRYDTDELRVIHEGQGVYYGAFTGEGRDAMGAPTDLWVVSRPHNWRPASTKEVLLHLNLETGDELGRVEVPSHFTHDAVRRRDKVYVASTGTGSLLQLKFPGLELEREMALFKPQEHVNTLAPTADGKLWALLHNSGVSALAEVDLGAAEGPRVLRRIEYVGKMAHGLVFWDRFALVLDSGGGALLSVDLNSGNVSTLWQLNDPRHFLKGLAVVDDVAFFGVAPHALRKDRANPSLSCALAAFDLKARLLLWWRRLPTQGMLNLVAAPHLSVESTAYSLNTMPLVSYRTRPDWEEEVLGWARQAPPMSLSGEGEGTHPALRRKPSEAKAARRRSLLEVAEATAAAGAAGADTKMAEADAAHLRGADAAGRRLPGAAPLKLPLLQSERLLASGLLAKYPPRIGGRWPSGYPRLELGAKQLSGFKAGLQLLLLRADVSRLKAHLLSLPEADWASEGQARGNALISGRGGNLGEFKPGVRSIMLMFSDQEGQAVARFPWYHRFRPLLEPLLLQVLGEEGLPNILRLQLALMPPHTRIRVHQDQGGYVSSAHRIHVVIATNPGVVFAQCLIDGRRWRLAAHAGDGPTRLADDVEPEVEEGECLPIHVGEEGLVFELNNRLPHYVVNGGDDPRIHLVMDVAEAPRQPFELQPGQECRYFLGKIDCSSSR